MINQLMKRLDGKVRLWLAMRVITTINVCDGLSDENVQKLSTFLVLTEDFGLSNESRNGNELSGVVGHVGSRPISVTRHLILELLKRDDEFD